MAYHSKWIYESDLQELFENGQFEQVFQGSEKHIALNNYQYPKLPSGEELDYQGRLSHWAQKFMGHLNADFLGERIAKTACCMEDGKILSLTNGFYEPSTKIWHVSSTLVDYDKNGKKTFSYIKEYSEVYMGLPRSLGAEHVWHYAELGSLYQFRTEADDAQNARRPHKYADKAHIADLLGVTSNVETIDYSVELPVSRKEDIEPHADGTVAEHDEPARTLQSYTAQLHITKIPFNPSFDWTTIVYEGTNNRRIESE